VITVAQSAKFAQNIPRLPATYLGAFESDLKDVTAAYSVFAAQGQRKEPYLIERIDDADGKIIYQARPGGNQAISPAVAWMIAQTLRGVIERGTAASAKSLGLTRYAAGKTGTTDDYKDAWFVGFTNSLTCGVWVGFDQPQTIQERGYGATLALPIWVRVMEIKSFGHRRLRCGRDFLRDYAPSIRSSNGILSGPPGTPIRRFRQLQRTARRARRFYNPFVPVVTPFIWRMKGRSQSFCLFISPPYKDKRQRLEPSLTSRYRAPF
jgi:membrane peptidoglycan carboxypeptidase